MDDVPAANWRFGAKPDYTLANLAYLTGKKSNHAAGSLEQVVEDLVKTWEMERSHKLDLASHRSIDPAKFGISANGGKTYDSVEAHRVGNYNVLLDSAPQELWDGAAISWTQSHDIFHETFAAFPWEVLKVFSGPPVVAFTWRHWGHFTGKYNGGHQGSGELIEMYGFGIATVDETLRLCDAKFYFDAEAFLKALAGDVPASATRSTNFVGADAPFLGGGGGVVTSEAAAAEAGGGGGGCPFKAAAPGA